MAHGRPWYQRNGGDFLMGTIGFPDVETRWVYSALIDMLNDRDRPVADDAAFVCGFTGLSRKKWSIARAYLIDNGYLVLTADGELTNPRFERERGRRADSRAASVEGGRRGGRASAAARAAGQQDLPLGAETTPDSGVDSPPETTPDSPPDAGPKVGGRPSENSDLAQPPPQGIARASEARGESPESNTTATASGKLVGGDGVDDPGTWDLLAIANRLAQAGAVSLHRETRRAVAMDLVKGWLAMGVDIEGTALPTIQETLRDTTETSIGCLSFYAGRVLKAHQAKRRAGPAKAPEKLPDPILRFDGEDERFVQLRRDLIAAMGVESYVRFAHRTRFSSGEKGNGDPVLMAREDGTNGTFNMKLMDGERVRHVIRVAREHGFTDVW